MPPPTLADVQLPPRRPLRDGSVSTSSGMSSRGSSRGRLPRLSARRSVTPRSPSGSPPLSPPPSPPPESSPRRFTAQEKGKGRAAPETIEVSSDEASPVKDDPEPDTPEAETDQFISNFTCPVCFCAPPQPALTPCGHVMCRTCLHASLLASIKRLPNPYPMPTRGRGRRGRTTRGRPLRRLPQPKEWTEDTLRTAYSTYLDQRFAYTLEEQNVEKENWEALAQAERDGREVKVEQVLKGLWKLGASEWVIEGECPVCRKNIPGGMGPPGSGIGGVKLLEARVGEVV